MKHLLAVLVLCLFAVPAFAGSVPAKTEFAFGGEFIKAEEGPDDWTLGMRLLFPLTDGGHLLLGPLVTIGEDDDLNRMGARMDWNWFGTGPFTVYVGGSWQWYQKDRDEGPQDTTALLGGMKIGLGSGAALDLSLGKVVDGVGKDETDQIIGGNIIARW